MIAALLAVAAAAPSSYKSKEDEYKAITIVSQSDERNLDGSSQWRYDCITSSTKVYYAFH